MLKPGGYFFLGSVMRYDKPAFSIAAQGARLTEYRQALIISAVSGKIDVRGLA